uniref:Paramyosin-like n=1 Tax=Elaeis guineensis var. tenera TaxID=51953 RepID=A0A6I9R498_ELAGV|nr:paramyosin-like [Elaeis guineensis]
MEKEEINLLKYRSEQLERNNVELMKKLDFIEEALQEAQESILHRDEELRWVERKIVAFKRLKSKDDKKIEGLEEWIRTLEKQKSEVERDYHRTHDDLEHLRRTLELIHYLNGYIKNSRELIKEVKKSGLEVEMLKRAREKAEKKVGEVFMRADATKRRAEDAETILRKTIEKNSRLLGKIKELKARLGAKEKQSGKVASKAVDFQTFEKYDEKRAEYSTDAYDAEKQSI